MRISGADLRLMRRIDELHLELPFAGARMPRELWVNHGSQVGRQALRFHQALFGIEPEKEERTTDERKRMRQRKTRRVLAQFPWGLLA